MTTIYYSVCNENEYHVIYISTYVFLHYAKKKKKVLFSFYAKKKVDCHRRTIAVDKVITF